MTAFALFLRRGGRDGEAGQFTDPAALRRKAEALRLPIVLRLPPGVLLEQTVLLPLAAARETERVLTYEMERLTPFTTDRLFWTWSAERQEAAAGRYHVRLSLVPRTRVQPLLDWLAAAGLRPVALEAPAAEGGWRRVALEHRRASLAARRAPVFAAVTGALACAAIMLPFLAQERAAARTEEQITSLRPLVTEAEGLRRAILDRAARTDVMQMARNKAGDALGTLAELTAVLPDDTYLTDLTLHSRALLITGESAAATRLIGTLSAGAGFRDPSFAAPVTRAGSGMEGFSIRAATAP